MTVRFGGCGDGVTNCLPITQGWNYLVRLYRPRGEVLDATWHFPAVDTVGDRASDLEGDMEGDTEG